LTQFRIFNLDVLALILEILDHRETFIHGVFLLSKVHINVLTEIHVRLLIEKFDNIFKDKLFYFTYSLNPILVRNTLNKREGKIKMFFSVINLAFSVYLPAPENSGKSLLQY
jgi:hypothetical protein